MKNQHEKTKGYRDLTQEEIDLINEVKELEAKANALLDKLDSGIGTDSRLTSIGATNLETGFMYLVKSIAKPERLVK